MDIEAIVINTARAWAYDKGTSWTDHMRAALTEQAETHAIELRACEATVQKQAERIRQLEAERVPDGWVIERASDEIIIRNHEIGGCVVKRSPTESRVIPESILWELANAMLAAAPAKEGSDARPSDR